ncbi:uncharacterized protein [Eurosta solidaginis]|uniref:uncharacterized protein n=1 Tax=Eurosta solidaginis TaxID=178769 RepID=UPI0035308318
MKKWSSLKTFTNINKINFLTLLEFCLRENNYFLYNETYYQQTYGMPMGNPLSPTIADIVLDKIIDDSIAELKSSDIYIKYITKYVDDIFAVVKVKDVDEILRTFNRQHTKIQFTIEKEMGSKLAFLDIEIYKSNNKLTTNWYTKSIASSRLINYHSNHPWTQKKNTIINFISKIYTLSDQEFINHNREKVIHILRKNCYPVNTIENLIQTAINKNKHKNLNTANSENTKKTYTSVTYIPHLTDNKTLHKIIPSSNTSYAHKPNHTLKSIYTKTKDKIEKEQLHNVVYEIRCHGKEGEKCNKVYIGTTKRSLGTRIKEHKLDAKNNKSNTALAQHLTEKKHTADFDNATILDVESRTRRRMTLEGLRIQQKLPTTINFKEDVDNINCAYATSITKNVWR